MNTPTRKPAPSRPDEIDRDIARLEAMIAAFLASKELT